MELDLEHQSMAGVLIDAGGAVSNSTVPEKSEVFVKNNQEPSAQSLNSGVGLWDENDKLVCEAKPYSDSKAVLKINHPLMIMVKEKRVVSAIIFTIVVL